MKNKIISLLSIGLLSVSLSAQEVCVNTLTNDGIKLVGLELCMHSYVDLNDKDVLTLKEHMIKYAAENVTKGESLATTKGQELFARNVQAHWKYKVELSKLKID